MAWWFVCLFFNGGGSDVQAATLEAKGLIGFTRTDVVDVAFPFEVARYFDFQPIRCLLDDV